MKPHELILQTKSQCSLLRQLVHHLAEDIERCPNPKTQENHENLEVLQSTYHILQTLNTSLARAKTPTGILLNNEGQKV
jgi:hypothetical protein